MMMCLLSRATLVSALLLMVTYMLPKAVVAAGAGAQGPPAVIAPPVGMPPWAINVPVQLANIPSRYPRFSVECSVWTPPNPHPYPFQSPNPYMIGSGKQDWSLDSNGGYSGTITVRVYLLDNFSAFWGQGGSYRCDLELVDANNQSHLVGPNYDPSLRPQQGTTFVASVQGNMPP